MSTDLITDNLQSVSISRTERFPLLLAFPSISITHFPPCGTSGFRSMGQMGGSQSMAV